MVARESFGVAITHNAFEDTSFYLPPAALTAPRLWLPCLFCKYSSAVAAPIDCCATTNTSARPVTDLPVIRS